MSILHVVHFYYVNINSQNRFLVSAQIYHHINYTLHILNFIALHCTHYTGPIFYRYYEHLLFIALRITPPYSPLVSSTSRKQRYEFTERLLSFPPPFHMQSKHIKATVVYYFLTCGWRVLKNKDITTDNLIVSTTSKFEGVNVVTAENHSQTNANQVRKAFLLLTNLESVMFCDATDSEITLHTNKAQRGKHFLSFVPHLRERSSIPEFLLTWAV